MSPTGSGPRATPRRAVRDVKHVDDLSHQRDARIDRDFHPAQTQRLAAAIPVLVEIFDAVGDRLGEAHLAGDIGAAMAARLDQLASDLTAVLEDVDDCPEPFGEPGFQPGMAQHEAQRLRQAAVNELEVLLEGEIVGEIQLADARRIAAAAKILQQQRVIEFGDLLLAEADFPADFDADAATSHTMAGRLPLGEIERMAEGAQQFGKRDLVELRKGERRRVPWSRLRGNYGRQKRPDRISMASPDHERINGGCFGMDPEPTFGRLVGR